MWVLSQRGMIKTNIRECDLRNLLLQTEEQVKPMVNEKKINFINLIQEKYIIQTDSDLLIIIVRNIINNAVKFTPKNGMITVGTIIKNGKNALYITDTGIGMSHEVIEKLFRIDAKLTTQGTQGEKGSGFGLIMSKELAMKLGYEIIVESTNGKGSTFFILMPLQDIPIR
jgi:two-component system, sensor histidine kinase and response regulator